MQAKQEIKSIKTHNQAARTGSQVLDVNFLPLADACFVKLIEYVTL